MPLDFRKLFRLPNISSLLISVIITSLAVRVANSGREYNYRRKVILYWRSVAGTAALYLNPPQPLLQAPKRFQELRAVGGGVVLRQISFVRARQHGRQFLQGEQIRIKRINE